MRVQGESTLGREAYQAGVANMAVAGLVSLSRYDMEQKASVWDA